MGQSGLKRRVDWHMTDYRRENYSTVIKVRGWQHYACLMWVNSIAAALIILTIVSRGPAFQISHPTITKFFIPHLNSMLFDGICAHPKKN